MTTSAPSKGEATRQRILAEAAAIFNQRGYEGCSMQAIMEATGLEKGGIYRHFENKEALAAEAFDYAWTQTRARRSRDLDHIPNPVDRLQQHIANFLIPGSLPGGCPLLNTAVDSANGNPVLRQRVREALHGWQSFLGNLLREGIDNGTVRPNIDTYATANHIIASLEGAMLIRRIEQNDNALRQAVEHLRNYVEVQIRQPRM
jgi:TetR/AcrR family transcriptional repressor of nem operon